MQQQRPQQIHFLMEVKDVHFLMEVKDVHFLMEVKDVHFLMEVKDVHFLMEVKDGTSPPIATGLLLASNPNWEHARLQRP
ncbi:hypothetical protein CgunFtcFv8_020129 [Champsocephalus gunnari]|uniref:Uncharacterized protein n=1 Tax=Champsocephalus gunnari TaxID=52237 RepID=A0AAN8DIP6_CHAGU|nr:hypothetical protein CgunFtcFv8_020129 [Champsocephalus gunnari]